MAEAVFKGGRHLTKSEISNKKGQLYKNSFQNLEEGVVYHDPMGSRTPGPIGKNSRDLKEAMWAQYQESGIVKEFDEKQKKGWTLGQTVEHIQKNYDTGDFSLPIFHVPEVNVVNPKKTPAADMIARETVETETVQATPETDQPDVEFGLETTDDTEGSYTYNDGTYDSSADYQYDVVGYGVATRLEDKLVLAADALRATSSVAERAQANGMRQAEEAQILLGEDAGGWDGFADLGTELKTIDPTSEQDYKAHIRELIDEVEFEGGDPGSIGVFVDFDTHRELREELDDNVRYLDPGDEVGFGFRILQYDGVPIMKSSILTRKSTLDTSGNSATNIFAVDMSDHYMGMLQDMTVKPLAKIGPQEQFATDAYGTLVSEAHSHIQYITQTVP